MGMDFHAVAPKNDIDPSFHLNWTGHEYVAHLLKGLHLPMTAWANTNDGYVVPAATAKRWGNAIKKALIAGRIMNKRVFSKYHAGEHKMLPVFQGGLGVMALDADDIEWIGQMAEFFIQSGGFTQD